MGDFVRLVLLAGGGAAIGIGLGIPSGALVGAMVGVAAGNLALGWEMQVPSPLFTLGLILIGANIGGQATRETLLLIRASALPAIAIVGLLILVGLGVGYLLFRIGAIGFKDALFAASPGAMSAVVGMSASAGANAGLVAAFHVLRIVMVTASLPLLLRLAR